MRGFLLLCFFIFSIDTLFGSTLVYMELDDIIDRSEVIIRGTVKEVESRYNNERTKIFTYTLIDVREVFKGKVPPIVQVRTFGGRVGDVNMKVPGMPDFKVGEEVFLFLRKNEDYWHISGMIQGKYSIEKDESGKEFLRNDFKGIVFKKVGQDNKLEDMKPEEVPSRYDYIEFVSKLKEIIKNSKAKKQVTP